MFDVLGGESMFRLPDIFIAEKGAQYYLGQNLANSALMKKKNEMEKPA